MKHTSLNSCYIGSLRAIEVECEGAFEVGCRGCGRRGGLRLGSLSGESTLLKIQ